MFGFPNSSPRTKTPTRQSLGYLKANRAVGYESNPRCRRGVKYRIVGMFEQGYVILDDFGKPQRVYRHMIGANADFTLMPPKEPKRFFRGLRST